MSWQDVEMSAAAEGISSRILGMEVIQVELLADKVNALAQREYVKGRDLYDIWFLTALGVETDRNLARRKFQDYGTLRPLEKLGERMQVLGAGEVSAEMDRFLPEALRRHLAATGYAEVLVAVRKVIGEVLE